MHRLNILIKSVFAFLCASEICKFQMYYKKKDGNAHELSWAFLICIAGLPEPQNQIDKVHDFFTRGTVANSILQHIDIVNVPIFHGGEALFKMKKAKYEATLYQSQCEDAKNMIALQVTQLQKQVTETQEKVKQAGTRS